MKVIEGFLDTNGPVMHIVTELCGCTTLMCENFVRFERLCALQKRPSGCVLVNEGQGIERESCAL